MIAFPGLPPARLLATLLLGALLAQPAYANDGAPGATVPVLLPEAQQDLRGIAADAKPLLEELPRLAPPLAAFPYAADELARDASLRATDLRALRPSATRLAALRQKAARGPVRVIVTLKPLFTPEGLLGARNVQSQRGLIANAQAEVLDTLRGSRAKTLRRYASIPALALEVDAEALDRLALMHGVAQVQEDRPEPPMLDISVPVSGAADAQDRGFAGSAWTVAVLDTGIDRNHPFLRGFVAEACFSAGNDCPNGETTQTGAGAAASCTYNLNACSHGSHVTGIATGAALAGITTLNGVARGAVALPIQVFSRFDNSANCGTAGQPDCECGNLSSPCALSFPSDQIAALEYVYEQRNTYAIAAVNMSLGGGEFTSPCDTGEAARKMAIDNLRAVGIATVISSGNEGYTNAMGAPACISSAISVGATSGNGNFNSPFSVTAFSNSASFLDLLAPGQGIVSACPSATYTGGQGWCSKNGTSMAAPHVAGLWALLQQRVNRPVSTQELAIKGSGTDVTDSKVPGGRTTKAINALEALGLNLVKLEDAQPRSYRLPFPLAHRFIHTPTRNFWSAVAMRPAGVHTGPSMVINELIDSGELAASLPGSQRITVVAVDNNAGRRPLNNDLYPAGRLGNPQPVDTRYSVELSNPGLVLSGQASGTFTSANLLRVYDAATTAGQRQFVRVVPAPGQDLELMAFTSTEDPATWVGGFQAGLAVRASSTGAGEAEMISFVPDASGYAGVVVTQRSGSGSYSLFRDLTVPEGTVVIDNNAASTVDRDVQLTLTASDAETGILDMRVDAGGGFGPWQPYASALGVTLPPGSSGTRSVIVEIRNQAGMTRTASDSISYTPPRFSVSDAQVTEGNSGAVQLVFTITASPTPVAQVSASYATADGTATAGSDYVATSGIVGFNAGQGSRTVSVTVTGDTLSETTETLMLNLSNPTGEALIADGSGVGSIVTDDAPDLSVSDASVLEGNSGTRSMVFTVSLSRPAEVAFRVLALTSNGTAISGSDYTAGGATLDFAVGEQSKTIAISVSGDVFAEGNETFGLGLSSPSPSNGARLLDGGATGTILDDGDTTPEPVPSISLNDLSLAEGTGNVYFPSFTLTLSQAVGKPVTVSYATADGTATAGSDYTARTGSVTIPAGQTQASVLMTITTDSVAEFDESFFLNLSNPVNATIADAQGRYTIVNDDGTPPPAASFSISSLRVTEGSAQSPGVARFAITLSQALAQTASVRYFSADDSAASRVDYSGGGTVLSFAPGQTRQVVTYTLIGDAVPEADEIFYVNLSEPVGAGIATAQGRAIIVDDDLVGVTVNNRGITEGASGTQNLAFTVTLAQPATTRVRISYATANGTATAGSDYGATSGSVLFNPGQTERRLLVPVFGDTTPEANETFDLTLTAVTEGRAVLVDAIGQAVIRNDD